ncbi:MAG: hypothetical protein K0R09_1896, partial [Clostridiales bacterium]|nr:hypothetical protein [Clostridiales bacterium]
MERSSIDSKVIINLVEKLNKGNYNALLEFWKRIDNNGTPLIEKIDGDQENSLVTFIYQADEEIENVVFMPPVGWNKYIENKMERLLKTNLWYITYKVRNEVRFKYSFSVNDSLDIDCEERWDNLKYDKFNKNVLVFKGEDSEEDEIESYVVMPNAEEQFWVKERNNIAKGIINEHQFHSVNLEKDRRIRIYTPHGYKKGNRPYKYLVLT